MKLRKNVAYRALVSAFAVLLATAPLAGSADSGTTISGRILAAQGGLPIDDATVELDRNGVVVATTKTSKNGVFKFEHESPGTYSFVIRATGYRTSRAPDLVVSAGEAEVSFQTAIDNQPTGLRQIADVATVGRSSLQTSATINTHVDTSLITDEGYQRLGDLLQTVPGVTTETSSSVGDDMSLSIRGYDPTETATLLDGHPIGPVGALGNGYNYNVSPFWGLSGTDVVFGSGATGLFGATTIAGAVNFQTVNPTQANHVSITQGAGTSDKYMTGFLGTGSLGKLGYAIAYGVQGTNGNFTPAVREQTALLQTSDINPGYKGAAPPPDLTSANVNYNWNNYLVSGAYYQNDFVGKLRYDFSPRTSLQFTSYAANDWSDSTGEGDNDYQTYPYVLYGAQQTIAGLSGGKDTILVHGKPQTCTKSIAVLVNTFPGYTCMTAQQYALNFYGPFGGGFDRWRTLGNQDYDLRGTQQLGAGTITVEGFADSYNNNLQKGSSALLTSPNGSTIGPGPYYLYLYRNRGYLVSDDFASSHNDFAFGYTWLHQANTNGAFPYTLSNGNSYNTFGTNPQLDLATASYFVRENWTPTNKFSVFSSFWLQRSLDTAATNFDPRISLVYRPDSNDVIRLTGGRSYSEPDPSLLALAPPVYSAPTSINCPSSLTGTGSLTAIAGVADPNLVPETAEDIEAAYGHRFNSTSNIQADVYQSWENNALLAGNVPISQIPQVVVPANLVNQYIDRLRECPGLNPTQANLAFSTTYNASGARYRGILLNSTVGVMRNVSLTGSYGIQSAAYIGVPQDILQSNTLLLDGGQIYGIPLQQGTASLSYQNPTGFGARIDETYVGENNSYNRGAFWYANASVSKTTGQVSVNMGVFNLFNNAAQQYGLIGLGVYQPQNYYGLAAQGGPTSALAQGSEQFGLPFRSYWLTVKFGI